MSIRWRAHLAQPEPDLFRGRRLFVFDVIGFNESRDHGPISVPLRLFCLNEIGQREQVVFVAGVIGDRRSPLPQLIERVNAA